MTDDIMTLTWAKANRHPELREQTIWEVFEAERPSLVPYRGPFDGFRAVTASVSKTCLVRFDTNKDSVSASAVGRPVEVRAHADRIEIRQDGRVVGAHARLFGRGRTTYDPWRHAPVLARKPGALRNGAPFKDWVPPGALERVRRKLRAVEDGDRQMVDILSAVLTDGLQAVEGACAEALSNGVHSANVVLNILARRRDPGPQRVIGDLLTAEISEKQARSIKCQIAVAKPPLAKELEDFVFDDTPVNETLVRNLAGGGFLEHQRNVVLIGGAGTGKTHIAVAMARSCIRGGARGRSFNVVDLVDKLDAEARAGRQGRIADHLGRLDFLVLDELGYLPFAQAGGQLARRVDCPLDSRLILLTPPRQQALRTHVCHRHDEPGLRRMAQRLRRREDDDRATRSPHPPLRHPRDRQ